MQEKGKIRKPLIIGIIAAVVILAALLVLVLTQCTGGMGGEAPTTESAVSAAEAYQIYWNMDRADYAGKSEGGMSSRQPAEDGYFYVRFHLDGEEVTLKVKERKVINAIDSQPLMGLTFDEEGIVDGVIRLNDMPLERVGWEFFVQSTGKNVLKLNSSIGMDGVELMLKGVDDNRIWDMTGRSGTIGRVETPIAYDRVMVVRNLDGEVTHVFIYDRSNYMSTHTAYCQHCDQDVEWFEWIKTDEAPARSGHFQLQADIQMKTNRYNLSDETMLCLDLNGHRIDAREGNQIYRLSGAALQLAVMDTSEAQTGVMASKGEAGIQGGVIWVTNSAFYMYGGTIDASKITTKKYAPAVAVSKGAFFYMYGGEIIGGKVQPMYNEATGKYTGGYAGSVYSQGKFVMNGGVIRDGRAFSVLTTKDGTATHNAGYGGNVVITTGGEFVMNGGVITGGRSQANGGNLYVSGTSEVTMNGGTIQGGVCYGKGRLGGNVFIGSANSVFTMNGGSIVGGVSYNGGGNVYCAGQYIMNSGYVASGALIDYATGKRNTTGASYNMMIVNGKLTLWGGTVMGGLSIQDSSADQKFQTQLNIYGWAKVHGGEDNKNLYISKNGDGVIVNVGTMQEGADVWVNASGIFTKPTKEANLQYFHSDVESCDVVYYQNCLAMGRARCVCGASDSATPNAHDAGCNGELLFWGPWTSSSSLPNVTGNYYLTSDVLTTAACSVATPGRDVKIDLNGYNVTREITTDTYQLYQVFRVYYGSKLTITDTTAKTTGKCGTVKLLMPGPDATYTGGDIVSNGVTYKGAEAKAYAESGWKKGVFGMMLSAQGGHAYIHNGVFDASNITGGLIGLTVVSTTGTYTDKNTNQSTVYYGDVNIYGGTIKCATMTAGSGNLAVRNGCSMNIYGGVITGGSNKDARSTCLYVETTGKLGLSGGKIDGGVYAVGEVTLSGAPVVGKLNEGLTSKNPLVVNGTLSDSASVYISGTGYVTGKTVEANKNVIHTIFDGMSVEYKDEKLYVGRMNCLCNFGKTVNGVEVTQHTAGCIATMSALGLDATTDKLEMNGMTASSYTNELKNGGNWFLSEDLTVGSPDSVVNAVQVGNGKKLVLDLNGHTLKVYANSILFSTQNATTGGAWIIITDTSAEGTGRIEVEAANPGQGGIIRLWGRTTVDGQYVYAEDNRAYVLAGTLDASQYALAQSYAAAIEAHHRQSAYMYGGTVIGTVVGNPDVAAAVRANEGKFYMYGGTIYGGKAKDGSVLQCAAGGTFHMYGGTICGGVNVLSNNVKITGSAVIDKDLTPAGFEKPAYSLQIASGKTVDFGGFTGSAKVTASGSFGSNATAAIAQLVQSEVDGKAVVLNGTNLEMLGGDTFHCVCGQTTHIGNCDGTKYVWTPFTEQDTLPTASGYYYLTQNVNLAANVRPETNANIYIDLNGWDINLEGAKTEQIYDYATNGNVTIVLTDCSAGEKGAVVLSGQGNKMGGMLTLDEGNRFIAYNVTLDASGFTNDANQHGTIAAPYKNTTFAAYNCIIKGGTAKQGAVIRMYYNATVIFDGCTVYGGTATNNGGVIYSMGDANTATINIRNTVINGGSAGYGGAIYAAATSPAKLDMILENVEIKNCTATTDGAALAVYTAATLQIKGNTRIVANHKGSDVNNLYINGGVVTIANGFTGKIGLAGKVGTLIIKDITLDHDYVKNGNIVVDDSASYALKNISGGLTIGQATLESRNQCVCGGVLNGTAGHTCTAVEFKPWTQADTLPTEGNWYLGKNVTLKQTAVYNASVNIDLNGKTIFNENGTVLNVKQGTVTITDSTAAPGSISGGEGSAIKLEGTAVLNLYGGSVVGGKSNVGGGVALNGNSQLNLAGNVQITANTNATGTAANNIYTDGGTVAFLPGFAGKVGIAGAYGKVVAPAITSASDALLTGEKVVLDDTSGNFKLSATASGLTVGLSDPNLKYGCVCGGVPVAGHVCDMLFWQPWEGNSLPTATGNYYLKNTVDLEANVTPASGAVIRIDLNGNNINLEGAKTEQLYSYATNGNATIVLTDSAAQKGSVVLSGTGSKMGGMMTIKDGNDFVAYNVTLDASSYVNSISNNMHGTIAATYTNVTFTTYNCVLKGGTAKQGGLIRMYYNSEVTVVGGTVYGGSATDGGVIYSLGDVNTARITFRDTVILNGSATATAGAIYAYANANNITRVTLENVQISNCSATSNAGAVYVAAATGGSAQLTLKGNTVITANTKGSAKNNIRVTAENGIVFDSSFTGAISINGTTGKALIKDLNDLNHSLITGGKLQLDAPGTYEFVVVGSGMGIKTK